MVNRNGIVENTTITCYSISSKVSSPGLVEAANNSSGKGYLSYPLPLLELQIGLIFMISHLFNVLLKPYGINLFVSSALTGIILGPTILGRYDFMAEKVFPSESQQLLNAVVAIGLHIFVFLSAVKMDVRIVLNAGRKAMTFGGSAAIVPFLASAIYTALVMEDLEKRGEFIEFTYVTITQRVIVFPVIFYILDELRITNSELGKLALSSALVADMAGLVITSATAVLRDPSLWDTKVMLGIFAFVVMATSVFKPAMLWIIRRNPEGMPIDSNYIGIIVTMLFVASFYFYLIHQVTFLGPIILGLTIPPGPPLGSTLTDRFEAMTLGVIFPVLVATSTMGVDFLVIIPELARLKYIITAAIILFAVKAASCLIPALLSKMPLSDAVAFTCILSSKGVIELAVFVMFRDGKIIREEVFAISVLFVLLYSIICPVLVKFLYDPSRKFQGYKARSIVSLKPRSELRVLACIHKPDDIASVIRMLNTTQPTTGNPVTANILHLIELKGRATPVFLTHEKDQPISTWNPYIKNVILSFHMYEKNNQNSASIHNFTAISPATLMYQDICTLALEKATSLILIPVTRKYSHALAGSENCMMKSAIRSVLEQAPCTIGIFLDRTKHSYQKQPLNIINGVFNSLCVIFIGGNDDREALKLAQRMALGRLASLTIVHIVVDDDDDRKGLESKEKSLESKEKVLDKKLLNELKQCGIRNELSVEYRMHSVKDGSETALLAHFLAQKFDLFIVGRRYGIECPQTEGLSQWSEFPELGIIGDFLASKDLDAGASILMIQQQRQRSRPKRRFLR